MITKEMTTKEMTSVDNLVTNTKELFCFIKMNSSKMAFKVLYEL